MKEIHLFYAPDIANEHALTPEDSAHAVRVLRMKEGDELMVTDGQGTMYAAHLTLASQKKCLVHIDHATPTPLPWQGNIHIAVSPTKNMDRMEWFVEKATEIGCNRFSFLLCKNSERKVVKTERIEKIVVAATKQSHKAYVPRIDELQSFKEFIGQPFAGQKFICHCLVEPQTLPALHDSLQAEGDALVLIGPEGDFSREEVEMAEAAGFRSVHLGFSRLRTETAALAAVHMMYLRKQVAPNHTK